MGHVNIFVWVKFAEP